MHNRCALLEQLIQVGIFREIDNNDEPGTFLDKLIIYLCKEKKVKLFVDYILLSSKTKLVSLL